MLQIGPHSNSQPEPLPYTCVIYHSLMSHHHKPGPMPNNNDFDMTKSELKPRISQSLRAVWQATHSSIRRSFGALDSTARGQAQRVRHQLQRAHARSLHDTTDPSSNAPPPIRPAHPAQPISYIDALAITLPVPGLLPTFPPLPYQPARPCSAHMPLLSDNLMPFETGPWQVSPTLPHTHSIPPALPTCPRTGLTIAADITDRHTRVQFNAHPGAELIYIPPEVMLAHDPERTFIGRILCYLWQRCHWYFFHLPAAKLTHEVHTRSAQPKRELHHQAGALLVHAHHDVDVAALPFTPLPLDSLHKPAHPHQDIAGAPSQVLGADHQYLAVLMPNRITAMASSSTSMDAHKESRLLSSRIT